MASTCSVVMSALMTVSMALFSDRVRYAAGVSFGLFEHVFGAERDFFGFDDAEQLAFDEKGVVGGTGLSGVFFDGVTGDRSRASMRSFRVRASDSVIATPLFPCAPRTLSGGQATQQMHAAEIPRVLQKTRSSFYHSPSTSARLSQDYFRKEQ